MIHESTFVVVDLETTGLTPKLDRIVEIGAVKVKNGEIVDEWDTLVNPGIFVPDETTQITGISTEMLEKAPQFKEIAEKFLSFFDSGIFVAHNVDFDRGFVNASLQRHTFDELSTPYLCTQKLAKAVHPNLRRYGLGALTETFDIQLPQAHRALHDARATAELLIKFLGMLQNGGAKELKDIRVIQNLPKKTQEIAPGQVSLF